MSNLGKRLITAGIGIPLLLLVFFAYDGAAVPALLLILVVLLLWECSALLQINSVIWRVVYVGIGSAAFLLAANMSQETFLLVFGEAFSFSTFNLLLVWFIGWVVLSREMASFRASRINRGTKVDPLAYSVKLATSSTTAKTLLRAGSLVVLVVMCLALYGLFEYLGIGMLLYVLFGAWITDTGAYFVGRKFGRRPLAKHISPSKTVEGLVGGYLAGLAFLLLFGFLWLKPELGWSNFIVVLTAFLIPITAVFGDLIESMFKRVVDAKDSGSILPGHGGLLDRIDSLVYAAPSMLSLSVLLNIL